MRVEHFGGKIAAKQSIFMTKSLMERINKQSRQTFWCIPILKSPIA
jgi:hypothetical protein